MEEFSQLYLTPEQRKSLYDEVKKITGLTNDFDIEEHIAEDFYKYVLSGQKLILNNSPKRNTIFRKIYNFLKELFTGTTDLQTYYERLYTGNINNYKRDLNNAQFGKLNSAIEGNTIYGEKKTLSLTETKHLNNAVDRAIASEFEERNLPFTRLFTDKGALNKLYNLLYRRFSTQAALAEEFYNQKLEEYGDSPNSAQTKELSDLLKSAENLGFIVNNWDEVVKNHKENSKYLKVAKDLIDDSVRKEFLKKIHEKTKITEHEIFLINKFSDLTNENLFFRLNSNKPESIYDIMHLAYDTWDSDNFSPIKSNMEEFFSDVEAYYKDVNSFTNFFKIPHPYYLKYPIEDVNKYKDRKFFYILTTLNGGSITKKILNYKSPFDEKITKIFKENKNLNIIISNEQEIEAAERSLRREILDLHDKIRAFGPRVTTFSVKAYLNGLVKVQRLHEKMEGAI